MIRLKTCPVPRSASSLPCSNARHSVDDTGTKYNAFADSDFDNARKAADLSQVLCFACLTAPPPSHPQSLAVVDIGRLAA